MIPGTPPPKVDYRTFENPYKAKFGDDWETVVGQATMLKPYVCVTEMVQHIHDESARMFLGTKFEDTWFFYHDALTLMCAKDTIQWMKEQKIYE